MNHCTVTFTRAGVRETFFFSKFNSPHFSVAPSVACATGPVWKAHLQETLILIACERNGRCHFSCYRIAFVGRLSNVTWCRVSMGIAPMRLEKGQGVWEWG